MDLANPLFLPVYLYIAKTFVKMNSSVWKAVYRILILVSLTYQEETINFSPFLWILRSPITCCDLCLTWASDCYSCGWYANVACVMTRCCFKLSLFQYKSYSYIMGYTVLLKSLFFLMRCHCDDGFEETTPGQVSSLKFISVKWQFWEES